MSVTDDMYTALAGSTCRTCTLRLGSCVHTRLLHDLAVMSARMIDDLILIHRPQGPEGTCATCKVAFCPTRVRLGGQAAALLQRVHQG